MPRVIKRFIYDDNGTQMTEGSRVLVNDRHEGIIHFDAEGLISVSGWHPEDPILSLRYHPEPPAEWPEEID